MILAPEWGSVHLSEFLCWSTWTFPEECVACAVLLQQQGYPGALQPLEGPHATAGDKDGEDGAAERSRGVFPCILS